MVICFPAHSLSTDVPDLTTQDLQLEPIKVNTDIETASIVSPTKAKVIVNTTTYAAPNPSTGETVGILNVNTSVWIVEKVWCSYNSCYYYYAGFTLNGKALRGYINEYNVYIGDSRLLPQDVDNETKPSGKQYTSLPATVYSGPRSEHASIGSIGTETITIIRREEMRYFIEYTVSSSGKKKRGFIHIDYIKKPTYGLLSDIPEGEYHIRNKKTGKYLTVRDGLYANYSYIEQQPFDAEIFQRWDLIYDETYQCYFIQPAAHSLYYLTILNGYSSGNLYNATLFDTSAQIKDRCFYIKKIANDTFKLLTGSSNGVECLDLSYQNSNNGTYTIMWYDNDSEYQEWVFERIDVIHRTETQDPLLMALADNGAGYTLINFRADTYLNLCGFEKTNEYKISGVECFVNAVNEYGENNPIVPDYDSYSYNLKINGVSQGEFYEWEPIIPIWIELNWHWNLRYYQCFNKSINLNSNNKFDITVALAFSPQTTLYPVSETEISFTIP